MAHKYDHIYGARSTRDKLLALKDYGSFTIGMLADCIDASDDNHKFRSVISEIFADTFEDELAEAQAFYEHEQMLFDEQFENSYKIAKDGR